MVLLSARSAVTQGRRRGDVADGVRRGFALGTFDRSIADRIYGVNAGIELADGSVGKSVKCDDGREREQHGQNMIWHNGPP